MVGVGTFGRRPVQWARGSCTARRRSHRARTAWMTGHFIGPYAATGNAESWKSPRSLNVKDASVHAATHNRSRARLSNISRTYQTIRPNSPNELTRLGQLWQGYCMAPTFDSGKTDSVRHKSRARKPAKFRWQAQIPCPWPFAQNGSLSLKRPGCFHSALLFFGLARTVSQG